MAILARWLLGAAAGVSKVARARTGPRASAFYWTVRVVSVVVVVGGWEALRSAMLAVAEAELAPI
jgi:hypothetical protein